MFQLWCERGFSFCLLLSIISRKLETDLICMFVNSPFSHVIDHNSSCLPPKTLHNHSLCFILGRLYTQEELETIGYAKFWGVNKVIMVYAKVVDEQEVV